MSSTKAAVEAPANLIRIVVVGPGGVGKSCLAIRWVSGQFVEVYDPTLEDSYRKQIDIDGASVVVDIIDTAGQDDFRNVREAYYRDGEGFYLVYDITSDASFVQIKTVFYDAILQAKRIWDQDFIPCVLVGNKTDKADLREVSIEEGKQLAESFCEPNDGLGKCAFFETSAMGNTSVDQSFLELVRLTWEWKKYSAPQPEKVSGRKKLFNRCLLF